MANLSAAIQPRQISPVASGDSVLSTIGIDCTTWLGLSIAERTNRVAMAYYRNRPLSSLTKADVLRIQSLLALADTRCIADGGMLLAAISTTCGDWAALSTAEKTRRLLVAFWAPLHPEKGVHIVWNPSEQTRLQAMIDSINAYCISQGVLPPVASGSRSAGQVIVGGGSLGFGGFGSGVYPFSAFSGYPFSIPYRFPVVTPPYPFSASYWLTKTGMSCGSWSVLNPYDKINAVNLALSYAGQYIGAGVAASLVRDIDTYCSGVSISSTFLSPYSYPYSPYGFGYPIPLAFPFIIRSLGFGGFGGGFGGFSGGHFGGHGGGGHGGK